MKRAIIVRALAVLLGLLVTVGLAEVALRIANRLGRFPEFFRLLASAYTPFDVKTGQGLYYAHPYLGYDLKPGYTIPGESVSINSLGFRGAEFPPTRSPDVIRIVALGGSTTYGTRLNDQETYPYYLQEELRRRLRSDRIEVINAGLVSATSAESLPRFLLRTLPLNPSIVVFYEGYNDLPPRMFNGYSDDYYHFRKLPQNQFSFWSDLWTYRLAAAGFAARLHYPNTTLLSQTWKFENLPPNAEDRVANFRRTSSAVYERNLIYMAEVAASRSLPLVLASFAFNDAAENWNDYMPDVLWREGIDQNNDAVRRIAARFNLPVVPFEEYARTHDEVFMDSIHMTAAGNQKMAAVFADSLMPLIMKIERK